jgi:hypothetical protein
MSCSRRRAGGAGTDTSRASSSLSICSAERVRGWPANAARAAATRSRWPAGSRRFALHPDTHAGPAGAYVGAEQTALHQLGGRMGQRGLRHGHTVPSVTRSSGDPGLSTAQPGVFANRVAVGVRVGVSDWGARAT